MIKGIKQTWLAEKARQELRDWEKSQDNYEQLGLNTITELDEEWNDGIPPEIQELIDWYKKD